MILMIGKHIRVVNPDDDMKRWCKYELRIANPEYAKKARMGFWLGGTPQVLTLYEKDGDDLILPYGTQAFMPPEILAKCQVVTIFPQPAKIDYHANVELYDYQEEAVESMLQAKFGILQSPAGSGKTQMGIAMAVRTGERCLWLCHTKDLINQSKERALRYIDKSLIGTITEGKVDIGKAITFATIQTMARLDLRRYENLWNVVIVDECHRVCGSPTAVTQYEKVLNSLNAEHKYGLSATVHRSDGLIKATYCLLGAISYSVPEAAVADKIMKVGVCTRATGTKISRECLNTDGTLNYTNLITYLTQNRNRNVLIAHDLSTYGNGHSNLILSDRLDHLEALKSLLPEEDTVMISGKMNTKKGKLERKQALDDMRSGKKHYLFATYSLAKEGLDIPCLNRLFLVTPQKDYAVVTQAIGRIDRRCEGKSDAICFDYVDDIFYLLRSWKKRESIYRKNNCYFLSEEKL